MHTRVQPYLHLTDGGVFELTQTNDDSQPWADTLEHLSLGEQVTIVDDDDVVDDVVDDDVDNDHNYTAVPINPNRRRQ